METDYASGLLYARLALGPHDNLVYALCDPATKAAAVIDPAFDVPRILELLDSWNATLKVALFTHHHADHTEGAKALHEATGCGLRIHRADLPSVAPMELPFEGTQDADIVSLGRTPIVAHHTPGHTPGGITYQAGKRLFTGDFLFVDTCGRVDFPGGSKETMWSSLQLFKQSFSNDYIICPGHDYGKQPEATLGDQIRDNPALAHDTYTAFESEWFLKAY